MKHIDTILDHLDRQRAEHLQAGRLPEVQRADQQLIAVRALAQLEVDRKAAEAAGDVHLLATLDAQGQFWARQVDVSELEAAVAGELEAGGEASQGGPAGDGGSEPDGGRAPRTKPKAS